VCSKAWETVRAVRARRRPMGGMSGGGGIASRILPEKLDI
jgi:hypothetical protein